MNSVRWLISTQVFEKPGFPQLIPALERAGVEYHQCTFDPISRRYSESPYPPDSGPIVLYGPIQFVTQNSVGYIPGAFGFKKDTYTSHYMSSIPIDMFFNGEGIFMPFGHIGQKTELLQTIFGDSIFIRPDSGFKSFTGFSVLIKDLAFELSALKQTKNIGDNEMCFIAKAKPIKGEYRFVVCENQVVTGSQYRWDDKLDVRIDIHHECFKFAQKVATLPWQLDTCYTLDVFLDQERGPKIGEINSFSSSGLYNCDMDKIVAAVSAAAATEYYG